MTDTREWYEEIEGAEEQSWTPVCNYYGTVGIAHLKDGWYLVLENYSGYDNPVKISNDLATAWVKEFPLGKEEYE